MGFRVIILIAVLVIIASGVIITLSRSQLKSTKETAEQVLMNHAKNIANSYAQNMLAELVDGFGSATALPPDRNFTNVMEAPNSSVTVSVHKKGGIPSTIKDPPQLEDDDYLIVSRVQYDMDNDRVFSYYTFVIYEHLKESKPNYLPMPAHPTPIVTADGSSCAGRFDGDVINFFGASGNAGLSSWSNLNSEPIPIYSTNDAGNRPQYFEQFDYVLYVDAPFRFIGNTNGSAVKGIDKSIMIIVLGDCIIETNVFPAAGSNAKIVIQATGDIHIGTHPPNSPRPVTRVEADLYAKGTIGPARGIYENVNAKGNLNSVTNYGGNIYPNQSQLYVWDVNKYPTGPNDPDSWEWIDYDVSVLRSWLEKTDIADKPF